MMIAAITIQWSQTDIGTDLCTLLQVQGCPHTNPSWSNSSCPPAPFSLTTATPCFMQANKLTFLFYSNAISKRSLIV